MQNVKGVLVWQFHFIPLRCVVGFIQALKTIIAQERPHVLGLQETRVSAAAAAAAAGSGTQTARKKTGKKTACTPSSHFTEIVKTILPGYDTFCEVYSLIRSGLDRRTRPLTDVLTLLFFRSGTEISEYIYSTYTV